MKLTICFNCFYNTNLQKMINHIYSLFDYRFTPNIDLNNIPIPEINIIPYQPIELIFVIDNFDITNTQNIQQYQSNIDAIYNFIQSLVIPNVFIRCFKTVTNSGVSTGRNIGIKNANGQFICFCDDDDLHINVNEILNIISKYNNYRCINCQISSKNTKKMYFRSSNISVCSGLFNVQFLRLYNIYFPEGIKTEDIIWRSKLYTQLSKMTTQSIIELKIGFYINLSSSNNSNELIIQNYSRNPQFFNRYCYDNIPLDKDVYMKIEKIFQNENEIDLNEYTIFSITSALNCGNGFTLLNKYAKNNIEKFDYVNKKFIQYSKFLDNQYVNYSEIINKEECLRLYCKYISLEELKRFSYFISTILNKNTIDAFEIFNILWSLRTNVNDNYLKIQKLIQDKNIELKSFKNFCFRYCCFKYLTNYSYKDLLSEYTKIKLLDLKLFYDISLLNINFADVNMYLLYNSKYNSNISFWNNYHYLTIPSNTFYDLKTNLINYFGENFIEDIDGYLNENTFENSNLFKNTYKGHILKVILYILSPEI